MKTITSENKRLRRNRLAAPRACPPKNRLPGQRGLTEIRRGASAVTDADTNEEAASKIPVASSPSPEPVRVEYHRAGTLDLYLREIGQVKLLTPEEELELAKRVKNGDDQAREQMIKANLRLVVKIARDYEGQGLPLLDLINEGNIGLMKGVERFDPSKGAKLSTYAALWIKQSVRRALSNFSKTIRLPDHVVDKLAKIRKAEMHLHEILDREPSDEELADHLGLDARRVHSYREAARAPVSLDAPISDTDSNQVSEVVADPNAAAPFERLVKETDKALILEVFGGLTPREQTILAMRFGLKDDRQKTLEEIGQHFGVTRERIRQIESEALKKLRVKMEARERSGAQHEDELEFAR